MNYKALYKYFFDINTFNVLFCILVALISGLVWSLASFSTVGIAIGYLGYQTFKKNEYYAYYNLGFTKSRLLRIVFFVNLVVSVFFCLIHMKFR